VEAYGGSIAKLGEVLEAIESGLMDIGDVHVPFEPAKLMAHNFSYFIPFGTPDILTASKAAKKVYDDYPQLKDILEKKYNQVFLGLGGSELLHLVTTFPLGEGRTIERPEGCRRRSEHSLASGCRDRAGPVKT